MIRKIVIKNYRLLRQFELSFRPDVNILVGDNDVGKSTLLEAINLALTGCVDGRRLHRENLSPFLFNSKVVEEWVAALRRGEAVEPPEFVIDLYLEDASTGSSALLKGTNNSDRSDSIGLRIHAQLDPDFKAEYVDCIKDTAQLAVVPTEYYRVDWLGFSGQPITARSVPATASFIDASMIRLQSGADYYLQEIIRNHLPMNERVELSRQYRSLREQFTANPSVAGINQRLAGHPGSLSDRDLKLSIDISQRFSWESSLVPHLDDLPFQYVGKGEQNRLKILLALSRTVNDAHIVLVEEPENHLSFSSLTKLVGRIETMCKDKQVIITTHSSFVLNKLGLGKLILLTEHGGTGVANLKSDTQDYFKKLSGYDTLRVVLAKKVILVEGPSDELLVQRAYRDTHEGRLPIEDGIDVINVRGLSFERYIELAAQISRRTAVVTDNDGKDPEQVRQRFNVDQAACVSVHVGASTAPTLEPHLLASNGRELLNRILGKKYSSDEKLVNYMISEKTTCAVALFETTETLVMPDYIRDAVTQL